MPKHKGGKLAAIHMMYRQMLICVIYLDRHASNWEAGCPSINPCVWEALINQDYRTQVLRGKWTYLPNLKDRCPWTQFSSIQLYLKCQFITMLTQDTLHMFKKRRGARANLCVKEKHSFDRPKPRVEPDSVYTDICCDCLGGRRGETGRTEDWAEAGGTRQGHGEGSESSNRTRL